MRLTHAAELVEDEGKTRLRPKKGPKRREGEERLRKHRKTLYFFLPLWYNRKVKNKRTLFFRKACNQE